MPPAPIDNVLKKIERHLRRKGGRMTNVRRDIVAEMAVQDGPQTAYGILAAVNKRRKAKLSAISVYRTLEFLIDAGVVLKIESKNAYELCLNEKADHSHLLIVCDKCGRVEEIEDSAVSKSLEKAAKKHGHALKHHAIELHGVCADC
ncbi:MAG: Fur family transcriptional regulator [Alphaproteobacteria bacterium]|nr:Fur family transcriptional regulator [Alphaproteobacteria bacterium]